MGSLGLVELILILGLVLLLFGSRLPKVGKSLGEGLRNFRKGLDGGDAAAEAKDVSQPAEAAQEQKISRQSFPLGQPPTSDRSQVIDIQEVKK